MIYDLGAEASPDTVAGIQMFPDVGGRFLRFREVVTVWLICRSFVSAVSVAAQVAALLRLPLRAGAILVIFVSLFSRCDSSVVAMGSMSFL